MKIAIVHDYLNQLGGAERCLEVLHEMFPAAPIFTLVYDKNILPQYRKWDIRPSFLQHCPGAKQKYRYYLPFFPLVVKTFDLKGYDVILSVSHAWVKGIRKNGGVQICYCLTPVRYTWDLFEEYMTHEYIPVLVRKGLPFLAWCLRKWDKHEAQKVDHFLSISTTIKNRIKKYYVRESHIVYPPVTTDFYCVDKNIKREDFYLVVSRLKAYKRIDLIIDAFNALGYPLKVVGTGPEVKKLMQQANENIHFFTDLQDDDVRSFYRRAKGFVYAGLEDFGIVMAEAQSCGLPVIAFGEGGAKDIVKDGTSGVLFKEQTIPSLIQAIKRFESMSFDLNAVRNESLRFDAAVFKKNIKMFIEETNNTAKGEKARG